MITHSQTNGAHTITMDDGKVNALNTDKLEALIAALAAADDQSPVVIKGRKGVWSAGFDLNGFAAEADAATAQLEAGRQAILAILKHPAPVITVCEGHAYPMGAFLMLAADHAIGIEGDFVCGMNESKIGMVLPLYATELGMARLNPAGRKAVATAEMFTPQRAMEVGYFDTIVAPEMLDATVKAATAHMQALNAGAFAGNKAIINRQVIEAVEAAPLPTL